MAVIGTKPQVGSDKNIHEPEPTKMLYETRRQQGSVRSVRCLLIYNRVACFFLSKPL